MRSSSSSPDPARAADHRAELERLERLAARMDSAFRVPLIGVRIGWDGILGLVPGIGDAAAMAPAAWIVWRAHRLGAPPGVLARMGMNVAVDTVVGGIPILGDLLDIGFKANRRNVNLLRTHLDRRQMQIAAAPQDIAPAPRDTAPAAPVRGETRR